MIIFTLARTYNITPARMLESMGFKKQGIISYYRFLFFKRWNVKLEEESDNARKLIKKILQKK